MAVLEQEGEAGEGAVTVTLSNAGRTIICPWSQAYTVRVVRRSSCGAAHLSNAVAVRPPTSGFPPRVMPGRL